MMKQIISHKYRRFVIYVEIFAGLLLLGIIYHFIPIHGATTFYIPSSDFKTVKKTLQKNGYDVTWIDSAMLKLIRVPTKGWYRVEPGKHGRLTFFEFLYRQKAPTMQVVIFAGESKEALIERLANDMKLDPVKLTRYYDNYAQFKEGDIIANRYTLARSADEKATMEYLFERSKETFERFKNTYLRDANASRIQEIRIIASIIQKESNNISEMPAISSVIQNRLKTNMRLQMDSTLNYGKYSHTVITPEHIKEEKSLFNTYKYKGLPPHALGTMSIDALKAASKPQKGDYLYFMLNKEGKHDFTQTYEEHLKNVKAFKDYLKEKKAQESNTTDSNTSTK